MKRVFSFLLVCLCLCLCLTVPSLAAVTSEDAVINGLMSGWTSSSSGYPTGYSVSWFWRVVSLLRSVDTRLNTLNLSVDGLSTSLEQISNKTGYIYEDTGSIVESLSSTGNIYGFLSSIKSNTSSLNSSGSVYKFLETMSSNSSDFKTLFDVDFPYIKERLLHISTHVRVIRYSFEDLYEVVLGFTDIIPDIRNNTEISADLASDLTTTSWLSYDSSSWYWQVFDSLYDLKDFFVSDEDVAVKDSSSDELSAFAEIEQTSFRGTDIRSLGRFQSGLKTWFEIRDVPLDATFEYLESGYSSWFSEGTAAALSVGGGSAAASGVAVVSDPVDVDTPYLDAYDRELEAILSGGD